ncbi:MAG: hypothetical protein NTV77_01185 [Candidatus Azambacteria bacterium]|nr:hypothetical protein [Candidatus Azambacteria bacterium]
MILHHYLAAHQMLSYAVIFFGMAIEGDILLFTAGFLTHQGYFDIGVVLLLVFLGAIIGDNRSLLKRILWRLFYGFFLSAVWDIYPALHFWRLDII